MTDFSTMTYEEQMSLVKRIGTILQDNELGDVPIEIVREQVSILKGASMDKNTNLVISKSLPANQAEKAKKVQEEIKKIIEGMSSVQLSIQSSVGLGDDYQVIDNVQNLEGDDKVSIQLNGQVILLDFWATWCPPCQAPMAHNQKMLEDNAEKWEGKARIIGLSIDQDKATLQNHVKAKGWEKVEHYFRGSESDASKVFGVRGVPHVMLIDKQGKIVFK